MLTGDENIVDITFQVVWNVRDPAEFLFNLADPTSTIQAVAESAMREVVSRSQLSPILSRDRGMISQEVKDLIQQTLDEYGSGVNIVRVNFDKADPPQEVIDAFREVQAARQERSTLQNRADAYANQTLAAARGNAAQKLQEAEGYRAQVVNAAQGEASRFTAVSRNTSRRRRSPASGSISRRWRACSATCGCSCSTRRTAAARASCPTCRSTSSSRRAPQRPRQPAETK